MDELLEAVGIPVPFDIEAFCRVLAERRGRAIRLTPTSTLLGTYPAPFSGLWIAGPTADYLFYDDSTAPLHWENSVLHELGHMLLGHRCEGMVDDGRLELLRTLFPNVELNVLRELGGSALGRSGYSELEEYEAELFAAHVWERAGPGRVLVRVSQVAGDDGRILTHLAAILGPQDRARRRQ